MRPQFNFNYYLSYLKKDLGVRFPCSSNPFSFVLLYSEAVTEESNRILRFAQGHIS